MIPASWRVHNPSPFDAINNARQHYKIGYVYPLLNIFLHHSKSPIDITALDRVLNKLPHWALHQYNDVKSGIIFSYLESCFDTVKPYVIRAFTTYDPRLLCTEVASGLLNSLNIEAVKEMELCGYQPNEELAKQLAICLVDAEYEQHELSGVVSDYAPVVAYLMSKGFSNIINNSIFNRL